MFYHYAFMIDLSSYMILVSVAVRNIIIFNNSKDASFSLSYHSYFTHGYNKKNLKQIQRKMYNIKQHCNGLKIQIKILKNSVVSIEFRKNLHRLMNLCNIIEMNMLKREYDSDIHSFQEHINTTIVTDNHITLLERL